METVGHLDGLGLNGEGRGSGADGVNGEVGLMESMGKWE